LSRSTLRVKRSPPGVCFRGDYVEKLENREAPKISQM
jgi:hypothetical protein